MSFNKIKQFAGKIIYKSPEKNEIYFEDENIDVTDEIEKSLIDIKESWNIPEEEINKAINSRKLFKKNNHS